MRRLLLVLTPLSFVVAAASGIPAYFWDAKSRVKKACRKFASRNVYRRPELVGLPDVVLPMFRGQLRSDRMAHLKDRRRDYARDLMGTGRCRNERRKAARLAVRYAPKFTA